MNPLNNPHPSPLEGDPMTTIQPLRLAIGTHQSGSGKGCAMNVVSWENGDTTITDIPACADPLLAQIVQRVNDTMCTHRDEDLLCPECSIKVLALAHRTVGTGGPYTIHRHRVWVGVAAHLARQVLDKADNRETAERAIAAAEAWADDPSEANRAAARAAADAATTAADADAAAAAAAYAADDTVCDDFADYADYAAAAAAGAYAVNAVDVIADAAADAVAAAATASHAAGEAVHAADALLRHAHLAVDHFIELTGHTEQTPDPAVTARALAAMTTRRR